MHNPINCKWGAQWYSPRDGEERLFPQASKSTYRINENCTDLLVQITELRASVIATNLQRVVEEYKKLQEELERISVSGDRTIYFN